MKKHVVWCMNHGIKIDTSYRNCKIASELLDVHFVHDYGSFLEAYHETGQPDIVFTGYVTYLKFCEWRPLFIKIMENSKRIIHFRDEWNLTIVNTPKRFLRDQDEIWTSIHGLVQHGDKRQYPDKEHYHYLNLNRTGYNPAIPQRSWNPDKTKEGLFYYGNFRKGRVEYFEKYFNTDLYKLNIVGSRGDFSKFIKINPTMNYNLYSDPSKFINYQMTLYIEDDYMLKNNCSISCRFYECLKAGLPIAFDIDTIHNFELAGIDIPSKWIVSDSYSLSKLLPYSKKIQSEQQKYFSGMKFFEQFSADFYKLCKERGVL